MNAWRSLRFRRVAGQVVFVGVIATVLYAMWFNLVVNMGRIGQSLDLDFLGNTAGIRIAGTDFRTSQTVLDALLVGVKNTLLVSSTGIAGAMMLGLMLGIARLSTNWLVARAAALYVQVVRNVPLLVIIFVWYFAGVLRLPRTPTTAGPLVFSVRGITVFGIGIRVEFAALLLGLVTYTASHIAEIVRGSIQAVPRGQTEAANAVGLSGSQRLRLVVLPQARRIALPQLANQFLNLTKNSSLGVAVAYPEIMLLSQQQIANRAPAPQTIAIVMLFYLAMSLAIAGATRLYERRTRWAVA